MVQRIDDEPPEQDALSDSGNVDERVGEAIEAYLALAEQGSPPEIEAFAARYPDLRDDVRAGLEGLELVHGLLGIGSAHGSGGGRGSGIDHRIESGRRIAGYRVVRELGRGGMGTVYEAVHVGLDRPVALKVLGVHAAPDSSARRRFLNEARTAAGLHHTHIVPVFDVGQVGGLCYYAMQRIEGSGLDWVVRYLRRSRPPFPGGGGGPASGRFIIPDPQGASGASSINSRLGQFWVRLSTGWLGRPDKPTGHGDGVATPTLPPGPPPLPNGPGNGAFAHSALDDSTASWGHASRQTRLHASAISNEPNSAMLLSASHGGLALIDTAAPRRDDEPVPFDPPRGSAYFRWVAEVGAQSADALAHAHHQGVIHRDVKPSNLLIDGRGNIWVTDFGLARRLADPGLTHHDSLLGTPRYMSPEQARTGSIDGRTDVYSLGATLYELLTLRPPFDGRSAAELIEQIGENEPVPPSAIDTRVPRDLETIVLKALAKRPADRYLTATELAEDLTRFLNHEPVKARRISPFGRLWRVARRHPGITSVTSVAAATILAIATFAYVRVVAERDEARSARHGTEQALDQARDANRKEQAAMKKWLVKSVEMVAQSFNPNRRGQGLDLIHETVALKPEAELRPKLRDEAVKFLVLREVEVHEPELPTGRTHGLMFGPTGHRLAVLSEDDEEISFWDVGRRHRQSTISLRMGAGVGPGVAETSGTENANGEKAETVQGGAAVPRVTRNGPGPTPATTGGRYVSSWFVTQRVALCGTAIAVLLSEDRGVALIELDPVPGAPPRILNPPNRAVLSVVADPGGRRLVTIEQILEDPSAVFDGLSPPEPLEVQVNLWDPDHLDRPVARLPWSRPSTPPGRPQWPLVAISPDGKTVAVAAARGKFVGIFSAVDGHPLPRNDGRNDGRPANRKDARNEVKTEPLEIDTQTQLSALAIGPNDSLATAGTTAGGVVIKIWNWADPRNVPTSLMPLYQNSTRVMRYSPKGTLLAIAGEGPIELWDPMAHGLVAVLRTNDLATDLAFAPDGRTLAAGGRLATTSVWTVHDAAARTQLSGFDSPPASLAFSNDGALAGGSWRGDVWIWRNGRCPEVSPPVPVPQTPVPAGPPAPRGPDAKRTEAPERDAARKGERDHGREREGGRPMNRGPMTLPLLAFDAEDRLVAFDPQGLRIWPAGSVSAQTPTAYKLSLPRGPMTGNRGSRFTLSAKTADGRHMAFVRLSSIFLWDAGSPTEVRSVSVPVSWGADSGSGAAKGARAAGSGPEAVVPQVRAIQLAPNADRIYLLDQRPGQSSRLRVWGIGKQSVATAVQAVELDWDLPLGDGLINIALRGDGELLALGDRAGSVTLVDTVSRRIVGKVPPLNQDSDNFVLAMTFSPDGQRMAIGSREGTISIWSVAEPKKPRLLFHLPGHRANIFSLAYDPQNRRLASAGDDPLVEVWDLELLERELLRLGLAD
jgi:serine/threonine protein kinase/WD40 repeat protein